MGQGCLDMAQSDDLPMISRRWLCLGAYEAEWFMETSYENWGSDFWTDLGNSAGPSVFWFLCARCGL